MGARTEALTDNKIARLRTIATRGKGNVEDALDGILGGSMNQLDPDTSITGFPNPLPIILTGPTLGPIDLGIKLVRVIRRANARRILRPINQAEQARAAEQAKAEHEALVEEIRNGRYHYSYIDIREPGEGGAFDRIQKWTINGTNRDGEQERLARSERPTVLGGYPITEKSYSGSHGETAYTPSEAEKRGRAIHAILYPLYQAEEERVRQLSAR